MFFPDIKYFGALRMRNVSPDKLIPICYTADHSEDFNGCQSNIAYTK